VHQVIESRPHFPVTQKVWGVEELIVSTEHYAAKYLVIRAGYQSSLHYHKKKIETFTVLRGEVTLEYGDKVKHLSPGDQWHIQKGHPHRFKSIEGATILEVSTHHDDEDVFRQEPSGEMR
jgi:mannose-6-phosphate isomerase-like protein (cupin superfamily)